MTNEIDDTAAPPEGQASIDAHALSPPAQWRLVGWGAAAVLVPILAVFLGGRIAGAQKPASSPSTTPPGTFRATAQQLKTFTIEPVTRQSFVSEELTEGKIAVNGDRATPVYSPYSGRVTRILVGPGDFVKKGAVLATLEATEFVQGQNDLRAAAAQVKIARLNESRKQALYEAKGGSLQDWQQAQADLTNAETALDAVRNRLHILGKSDEDIAALGAAATMNPSAALTAPIAGIVVDRQLGPGQFLQSGAANPVFTIADPSSVWLLANVREADAGQVKVGQSVEVRVLAYPQRIYKARITHVSAVVDPATHRLPVRADIDNPDGSLKPEMFARFRILTSDATQSAAVPEAAVVYEGDAAHVWVLTGDDLLVYRPIHPGRNNDGVVEVLDGLKPGERIVTKGGLFIDQLVSPVS